MKTDLLKSLLVNMALLMIVFHAYSQDLVGTRIDVQGTRFSDQMWLFSVASCTNNFDNGWDGFKMFGTSLAPQLFALEPDGDYQVASIPDFNDTYLGFSAGIDSVYTFTFTHQNLAKDYQQLYLIDSVANKTVNIYQSGTTYTFTASATTSPVKRFKIVTSNPADLDSIPTPTSYVTTGLNQPNSGDKNIKIYYSDKDIYIENASAQKGKMILFSSETGKVLKTVDFNSDGRSIINTDAPRGVYVVNCVTQSNNVSTKIIVK